MHPTALKLLEVVDKNFKARLSVKQYAALLYVSESQLNRHCKAAFEKTTQKFIQDRIIKEAKNLLTNTQASIKELA
jgi:AraC family transcriptional regulator, transcriptional activator of pobA